MVRVGDPGMKSKILGPPTGSMLGGLCWGENVECSQETEVKDTTGREQCLNHEMK